MSADNIEKISTGANLGQDLGSTVDQLGITVLREVVAGQEENESYSQLVWRRFRRSKASVRAAGRLIS